MTRHRILLILLCAVGVLIAGGLAWRAGVFKGAPSPAAVGGPFQLVDQTGRPADEGLLKGKWNAVFFGYTYCPDVCPGTLQALIATSDLLGPRAADLRIVFLSIDPERDRPAVIRDWLSANGAPAGTVGLTGTPEQVAAAVKVYRAYAAKRGEGPGYLMDHSSTIYLMGPDGQFRRVLAYGMTPDQMAEQIRAAMRDD